jgi:hypothetical protein
MGKAAAPAGGRGTPQPQAVAAPHPQRQPTLLQRLSCATYIYLIPACLLLNLLCLCNRYTACAWFM